MATSKIKYDGDTVWKTGTTSASAPIKYRLRNGICTLTANYSGQITITATASTVMTLSEEYRPSTTVYFVILNRAASTPQGAYGSIDTDGKVSLLSPTGSMGYFEFCVSYPVK